MEYKVFEKPRHRSQWRIRMGRFYFTIKRYSQWYLGGTRYARHISGNKLAYKVFGHQTPLIRKLRNVDMQLQYNKIRNLAIAVKRLNGIVIEPGGTFSYWKLIGKPGYRKGYLDGLILNPDGTFGKGAGGGLCQLSNLIYWMTLHTPLTVTERYRHSHDIFPDAERTQPFGSGATCVYNYMDLQIYNGTGVDYQLTVYLTDDHLAGEWRASAPVPYRYEVYEKEHSIASTFWGGYIRNNTIFRYVYNVYNELIADELVAENHAVMMYRPLLQSCSR